MQEQQQITEASDVNQENSNNDDENTEASTQQQQEETASEKECNGGDDTQSKDTINGSDPVMEIEGVVHGEPDNNVVQSASRFTAVDDEDNKV